MNKDLYSRTSLKKQHEAAQAVGLPEAEGVSDAFYPFPNKAHGHELQNATDEVEMAAVQVGEGTRQKVQNPDDEVIK
jgi:hypothetical protein